MHPVADGADGDALARVRGIDLVLTAACNLRCSYCYQDRKRPLRMAPATIAAAVALLGRSAAPRPALNFFGGEPLLAFDLLRAALERARRALPEGRELRPGVCTNGTLLDAARLAWLDRQGVEVQLSLDGAAEAQDLRAPGTFARLDALLGRVRRDHPEMFRERFSVAVTLTSRNLGLLADSVDYLLARGVREIGIAPLVTHDGDWRPELADALEAQWERIWRSSLAHLRETGRTPVTALRRVEGGCHATQDGKAVCSAGAGTVLTVDVDGRVWPCVLLCGSYRSPHPGPLGRRLGGLGLGRVDDPRLGDRLAGHAARAEATRMFHRIEGRRSLHGECRVCPQRHACSVCPVSIAHVPDNDDPRLLPEPACALQRAAGRRRERYPAMPGPLELLRGETPLPLGVARLLQTVGRPTART